LENLHARIAQVHWTLVVTTAILIYLVTLILGVALSFPLLAILNGSHLSSSSALQVSSLVTTFLVIVVTGFGALMVARRSGREALLHGFLVGLVIALLSLLLDLLFHRALEMAGLVLYILMVAAGALGGVLGSGRQA